MYYRSIPNDLRRNRKIGMNRKISIGCYFFLGYFGMPVAQFIGNARRSLSNNC